jgi:hypothetical protein
MLVGTVVACAAFVRVVPARANGRFPASNQIVFSPASPSNIVVRTTFGIIFSSDAAITWHWLCEDTLGLPPTSNEDPYIGITAGGSVVAGLSLGLERSTNAGCDWSNAGGPLAGQLIKDLDVRKDNPHTVDLITSTFGPIAGSDGGPGYAQQTYESTDDGAHWTAFGTPIDPSAIVTTIDFAPSDPTRIYASAFRGSGAARTASLFVSKDKGTTWVEHAAPLDAASESAVYIGAVDPKSADVVYLRSEGNSRLSFTRDGGQTFQTLAAINDEMLGLTLSHDGSKIYIGGAVAGLLVAPTATMAFAQTSKVHIQCLVMQGADLWACSDEVSGFAAGVSKDDGKTFTSKLHLLGIEGPIVCGANSMAAECSAWDTSGGAFYNPFVGLCTNLGACDDAGPAEPLTSECFCSGACSAAASSTASDYKPAAVCPSGSSGGSGSGSGGGADGGGASSSKSSGGCSIIDDGGALGAFAAGTALTLAGLGLRRRSRRPGAVR